MKFSMCGAEGNITVFWIKMMILNGIIVSSTFFVKNSFRIIKLLPYLHDIIRILDHFDEGKLYNTILKSMTLYNLYKIPIQLDISHQVNNELLRWGLAKSHQVNISIRIRFYFVASLILVQNYCQYKSMLCVYVSFFVC